MKTKIKKHDNKNKSNDSYEKILSSAEELFIERGFDGVSINDVAVHAGVAKALVFYYFKNKQILFDTVLEDYYKAQSLALMSAISAKGDIRTIIHNGVDAYLDFVERNPGYPKLIQREVCSGSKSLEKIAAYMTPLYAWGTNAFGEFLPDSGPASKQHFFTSFFGMAINYYTYSPILGSIFNTDPMGKEALAERRQHIHLIVDSMLDGYITENNQAPGQE
ncbi:MAG TPA: TetR family transcriptional regulator [bacterium]|nr:TetR family transcriptional regulator [bacterium]